MAYPCTIINACMKRTNFHKSVKWKLPRETLLDILYSSTIRPIIEYGNIVFTEMAQIQSSIESR
jgi:hypothetical protein